VSTDSIDLDHIEVRLVGTVTNPPATPAAEGGAKRMPFKKGEVLWQTKQAPDGYRFKVLEDRGATVLAQPLDPETRKPVKGEGPVELNAATVAVAKD